MLRPEDITPTEVPMLGTDVEFFPRAEELDNREGLRFFTESLPPKGQRLELNEGRWAHRDGMAVEVGCAPLVSTDQDTATALVQQIRLAAIEAEELTLNTEGERWWALRDCPDVLRIPDFLWGHRLLPAARPLIELGCDPDLLATSEGPIERRIPDDHEQWRTRTAGFHLHLSLPRQVLLDPMLMVQFVRQLDDVVWPQYLEHPFAIRDNNQWYRQRRLFRAKPYGVEYRSMGSAPLNHDSDGAAELVQSAINVQLQWWRNT